MADGGSSRPLRERSRGLEGRGGEGDEVERRRRRRTPRQGRDGAQARDQGAGDRRPRRAVSRSARPPEPSPQCRSSRHRTRTVRPPTSRAIEQLSAGLKRRDRFQTLLGATGTGKTATMAWTIEQVQKPTLVIAHNKTRRAALQRVPRVLPRQRGPSTSSPTTTTTSPRRTFPQADLYIEKDSSRNDDIDRLRHSATSSLLSRRDTIVVASVSAIYGLGSPGSTRAGSSRRSRSARRPTAT